MTSSIFSLVKDLWSPGHSAAPAMPAGQSMLQSVDSTTRDNCLVEALVSSTSFLSNLIAEIGDEDRLVRVRAVPLAGWLRAASKCLKTEGTVISESSEQRLLEELLQELVWIVTWPAYSRGLKVVVRDPLSIVQEIILSPQNNVKATVAKFLAETQYFIIEATITTSQSIISTLTADIEETAIPMDEVSISYKTAEDLLTAIWDCSACNSCDEITTSEGTRFHPSRLYLGRPRDTGDASALFDVFTSSHSLEYWQEIGFSSLKKKVEFAGEAHSSPSQKVGVSDFCKILSTKNNARVFLELGDQGLYKYEDVYALHHDAIPGQGISLLRVLHEYHLDVPEKVVLSHAIAREFWQLYETKMMLAKWSSGNIWFMPNTSDPTAPLPCKAYISFPFEQAENELEEYSTTGLIHKCPRIFSLAILLLEIGLGRPIQTSQLKRHERDFAGEMNKDYSTASKLLKELKDQPWGDYTGKHIFNEAIHACMTGRNFSPSPQSPGFPMKLSERREVLYEKVVSPLQWLASAFPNGDAACFEKSNHSESSDSSTDTIPVRIDELCPSTFITFHSGKFVSPEEWLNDLKRIGRYIHQIKQQHFVNADVRPTRVAILDSGCCLRAPYFQEDKSGARAGRIKAYKDFVDKSEEKKDSFGHGTFMTALAIEAAPTAEFYVARVAENTAELDGSEGTIGKAIIWAGCKQKVDIISMSFGVTDSNDDIKNAILQVRAEREDGIIFLASAGNSGPHQDTAFPASRRDVISIRATNYMGTSSDTNPASDLREPVPFATFGDNIPPRLLEYKPDICGPGSSVSTVVAAGIAASILSYSALLQLMYPAYLEDKHLKKLRTVEGMEALFLAMSTDMGNRIQFINPVKFFADRPTNLYRLCAIVDCIRKVG